MKIKLLLFFLFAALVGCKSSYQTQSFDLGNAPKAPNYKLETSWAVLPSKYSEDFKVYASNQLDTLKADVFYVYPTLNSEKKDARWNVPIDDEKQQKKVLGTAVLMQASAFSKAGKLYVPFYRQAHIRSFRNNFKKEGKQALDLAYSDVKRAFKFYLENYNNGRPIIMVGHSQGTTHTLRLLADFFDNKPLQEKLIAAYIPGIGVKPNTFLSLKPMKKPSEVGGFVSWNTFKKGHYPKRDKNWYDGSVTTNPITWNNATETTLKDHKGFLYTNGKIYKNALKIEVIFGLVWSSNPKFPFRFFMSFMKNYHAGDINLFWKDIQENVQLRVETYLAK